MNPLVTFNLEGEFERREAERQMSKLVGETLVRHYPGRAWHVQVNGTRIAIKCPDINASYGFVLFSHRYATASELSDAIMRAGGEILERSNLSREKGATGGEEDLKRDARGDAIVLH